MGDPKRTRKKYTTPSHPWQRARMEKETQIRKHYGIRRKKEIWKMDSLRKRFTDRAKILIASRTEQSEKERDQMLQRLLRLGLIDSTAKLEDVLGLSVEDIMERRLQTIIWKKGYSKSPQQARQFIVHGHVIVAGKKITSPSYIVLRSEETQIMFLPTSSLAQIEHPERASVKQSSKSAEAVQAKAAQKAERGDQKKGSKGFRGKGRRREHSRMPVKTGAK